MAKDWTNLFKKYRGQWVALDDDEVTVISAGATAKNAHESALKKGYKKPILTHVPKDLLPFAGMGIRWQLIRQAQERNKGVPARVIEKEIQEAVDTVRRRQQ